MRLKFCTINYSYQITLLLTIVYSIVQSISSIAGNRVTIIIPFRSLALHRYMNRIVIPMVLNSSADKLPGILIVKYLNVNGKGPAR